jgi:hypothetical protein
MKVQREENVENLKTPSVQLRDICRRLEQIGIMFLCEELLITEFGSYYYAF